MNTDLESDKTVALAELVRASQARPGSEDDTQVQDKVVNLQGHALNAVLDRLA